jgi:hypothetical protein
MDNSVLFGRTDDGGLRPPKRGEDGGFHLAGALEVTGKDHQMEVLNLLLPVLEQLRDLKVVFIAPMPIDSLWRTAVRTGPTCPTAFREASKRTRLPRWRRRGGAFEKTAGG